MTGLTFAAGQSADTENDSACVWVAEDHQGEVVVLVGAADSAGEFDARVDDATRSLGPAASVEIAGASASSEFGDFGLIVMTVDGRLVQIQQSLPLSVSPTLHRDIAAQVARSMA